MQTKWIRAIAAAAASAMLIVGTPAMASTGSEPASLDEYIVREYTGLYEDRGTTFNPAPFHRLYEGERVAVRTGTGSDPLAKIEFVRRDGAWQRVTAGWWDTDFVRSSKLFYVHPLGGWRWGTN